MLTAATPPTPGALTSLINPVRTWHSWRSAHHAQAIERKKRKLRETLQRNDLAIAQRKHAITTLRNTELNVGRTRGVLTQRRHVADRIEAQQEELYYMVWVSESLRKDLKRLEGGMERRKSGSWVGTLGRSRKDSVEPLTGGY